MMHVRRGLLVQTCQLLAQLFLDWCVQRDVFNEPFSFVVPIETVDASLNPDYTGVMVTVAPIKKRVARVRITPQSVVHSIAGTIGDKNYQPPPDKE